MDVGFDVWRTHDAEKQYRDLRADVQKRVDVVEAALAARGCAAADYRLEGAIFDSVCAVHLKKVSGQWRVLVFFPTDTEVAVFFIGQHDRRRAKDVYDEMASRLRIERASGARHRSDCCTNEGIGPPADALLARFDELSEGLR